MEKTLSNIWREKQNTYGKVQVQLAIARNEEGWRLVFGRFIPLSSIVGAFQESEADYGAFRLFTKYLSKDVFSTVVDQLVEYTFTTTVSTNDTTKLSLPDVPPIPIAGRFQKIGIPDYLRSRFPDIGTDWPAHVFIYCPNDRLVFFPPSDHLVSKSFPLYPDGTTAIEAEFTIKLQQRSWSRGLVMLLPNYAARIAKVEVGKRQIRAFIERRDYHGGIHVKLYQEGNKNLYAQDPMVNPGSDFIEIPLGGRETTGWMLYILDDRGDVLDYRDYRYPHQIQEAGDDLILTDAQELVPMLLSEGEGEQLEFKEKVKGGSEGREFIETVVAFANTRGGSILVGIDDNGMVSGVSDPQETEGVINNLVRELCDPPVKVVIDKVELQGKPVTWVKVPEGTNRPYVVKGRGAFIRANATDRVATHTELLELIPKNYPTTRPWPY